MMDKAEQPTITQAQYESAVKGRQDFRNAYRNLLPVLRAAEGIVAIWRAKGRKVDVTEYWDAINAIDVAVTGGGAKPDPEHLTRTTSLAAQNQQVLALVEAARDAGDVLQSAAAPSNLDPQFSGQIAALGERIGYGALMHGASALWRKSLGDLAGGEFAAGPCVSTAASRLARLDDALMPFRGETLPATPSLAAQEGLVEALRADQDRIVGLMAAIKQGRSSTPRCEPPTKWDKDWCLDQFGLVVAALEALSAIKEQHHD